MERKFYDRQKELNTLKKKFDNLSKGYFLVSRKGFKEDY